MASLRRDQRLEAAPWLKENFLQMLSQSICGCVGEVGSSHGKQITYARWTSIREDEVEVLDVLCFGGHRRNIEKCMDLQKCCVRLETRSGARGRTELIWRELVDVCCCLC